MNRSADWLHKAHADLDQALVSAKAGHHEWASRSGVMDWADPSEICPPPASAQLGKAVTDLEDRLRILDALYIPTRYLDSLPDRTPTDHFGRLQSDDALRHARAPVDAIRDALA